MRRILPVFLALPACANLDVFCKVYIEDTQPDLDLLEFRDHLGFADWSRRRARIRLRGSAPKRVADIPEYDRAPDLSFRVECGADCSAQAVEVRLREIAATTEGTLTSPQTVSDSEGISERALIVSVPTGRVVAALIDPTRDRIVAMTGTTPPGDREWFVSRFVETAKTFEVLP